MTTAHRPTFDPARGKEAQRGPAYHQRLLPAHKTLKYRQANQGTVEETSRRDLRAELLRAERKAKAEREGKEYTSEDDSDPILALPPVAEDADEPRGRKRSFDETKTENENGTSAEEPEESYEAKKARVLEETRDIDASSSGSEAGGDDSSSEDDSSDDDDEEARLMLELAKIKRERAAAAAKAAEEQAERDEAQREKDIAYGNPLLDPRKADADYGVKRRWDDDVVFRNQARGTEDRVTGKSKEFVNDLLRSDFHKKFMNRYIR